MPWHSIRGVDRALDELRRAMVQGRFPHAFLFVGPEGVGKRTFALEMARALLCERVPETAFEPCDACPSCLQVQAGTHPDVLQVARPEDKQDLPIKLIRDLCLDLGLKPMRGHRRVAIVDDADDLNDEAANAFLKTLEEPPPGSVLVLIGTSTEAQLDTIVSRCRVIRFDPLPEADVSAILLEQGAASDLTEAARLARLGGGSVSKARGLADPGFERIRRDLINALADPDGYDPSNVSQRLDGFVKEGGGEAVDRRQKARLVIGELAGFLRGVLWQTAGLELPSADTHDHQAATELAARVEPEDVFLLAERCFEAEAQIQRNAYLPLVFDALARDLGVVLSR